MFASHTDDKNKGETYKLPLILDRNTLFNRSLKPMEVNYHINRHENVIGKAKYVPRFDFLRSLLKLTRTNPPRPNVAIPTKNTLS